MKSIVPGRLPRGLFGSREFFFLYLPRVTFRRHCLFRDKVLWQSLVERDLLRRTFHPVIGDIDRPRSVIRHPRITAAFHSCRSGGQPKIRAFLTSPGAGSITLLRGFRLRIRPWRALGMIEPAVP